MFCTACASYNPATLLRCSTCGAALKPAPMPPAALSQRRPAATAARLRWLLVLLPLLTIAGAVLISVLAYRADRAMLASAYERAESEIAQGDYAAAIAAFDEAGDYRDAPARLQAAVAAEQGVRAAYLTGVDALEAGDFTLAIASFTEVVTRLPNYGDAAASLDQARTLRTGELYESLQSAEESRDWTRVEQALLQLMTGDPGNADLKARYAQLARTHSPMVFAREGGIYLISPDLLDEQLVTEEVDSGLPAWSPDRSRIAFFGSDGAQVPRYGLYVVNPDGSGLQLLASNVRPDGWPVWSPDGARIAFSSVVPFQIERDIGISSLHVVDLRSGIEVGYTSDRFLDIGSPTWSPDGTDIAFVSRSSESLGPALGRSIAGTVQLLDLESGEISSIGAGALTSVAYVTWSPTSSALLVLSVQLGSGWNETQLTTIDQIDLATGEITPVGEESVAASYPVWSPDGRSFAFAQGSHMIQVRSAEGAIRWITVPRAITPFLSWSMDGSALFAPSNNPNQASMIVPIAGGVTEDVPLVFSMIGPPRWAPLSIWPRPDPATSN